MRAAWILVFLGVLAWSGIDQKDYPTWGLEVAPAVAAGIILWVTRERFPLTTLSYVLILVHAVILMIGGHYTYAEVPVGEWVRVLFDGARNDYDKLGHLAQGFVRVSGVHLMAASVTKGRSRFGCIAERPVKGRGIFHCIGHDGHIMKIIFIQDTADLTHPPVHHIRRGHHVGSRLGV